MNMKYVVFFCLGDVTLICCQSNQTIDYLLGYLYQSDACNIKLNLNNATTEIKDVDYRDTVHFYSLQAKNVFLLFIVSSHNC